jgi:hypothetical protein
LEWSMGGRKTKKQLLKKPNREKNQSKFWKTDWFGFSFISLKSKKLIQTEPKKKLKKNRVKPEKPSQTDLNRFLSKKPNQNQSVWIDFSFFFKIWFDYYYYYYFWIKIKQSENDDPWMEHRSINNYFPLSLSFFSK